MGLGINPQRFSISVVVFLGVC